MTPIIKLNDVSLIYSSVAFEERSIKNLLANLINRKKKNVVKNIPALNNISLTIKEGERVGLLGHNGAGKSTFLKMLAGLYPISSGERLVQGKIRSLFDLSLGFEPDATGRENILYRGLLLGMTPKQVVDIKSSVIDFAGLGDFIDYPVKTYSAGMQVRLAFAISTVTKGDILLLDEVISAGDTNFMVKARDRMLELIESSQILVFASHDFSSLKAICNRGVVLQKGSVVFDGPIEGAIDYYKNCSSISITDVGADLG